MKAETKSVSHVILRDNILEQIKHAELYSTFRKTINNAVENCFNAKWIGFSYNGAKGYWNKETQVAVPVQSSYGSLASQYFDINSSKIGETNVKKLFGLQSECPFEIMSGIKSSKNYKGKHFIGFNGGSFAVEDEQSVGWHDSDSIDIGTVKISAKDFKEAILTEKYKILTDDTLKQAVSVLKQRSVAEVSEKDIDNLLKIFKTDRKKIEKEVHDKVMKNFVMTPDIAESYIQSLLKCDTVRADIEPYEKKCLTDVNSGHWELWTDDKPKAAEGQVLAKLEQPLRARNPLSDIHDNGLIGIDFGTKSTIVSVQDGQEHTTLLRVGIGKLNKAPEAHHYENPTIMEFINFEKFLRDYKSRNGRPMTSIDDLRVSHAADKDLKSCDNNSFFDSFFYDIKQWCGDDRRTVKLIDQKNKNSERELPPFVSLKKGDFNPLELYAYYLGLYINDMRKGIYLDYVLSFPVTYKLDVKKKILESFKAGLWKSLPEAVQKDEEASKKFRVRMGVSEPEAYAITALQGYGFDPDDENEKYLYSIFDFGGGTTDFDFGIWRGADDTVREEEDKDYVIEHINSEGDKYLGGENLLELLAFEIFKANNDFMRKGKEKISDDDRTETVGFSFTLPPECVKPSGCETTIKNTPSAKRNTKQLMEVLRPFWEGIIGIAENSVKEKKQKSDKETAEKQENSDTIEYKGYIFRNDDMIKNLKENGTVKVSLFDNNGDMQAEQTLYIKKEDAGINVDLIGILEKRIERGVKNFFASVMLMFDSKIVENSGVDEIQIFLAGNSSKSPILKKLFNQYIQQENNKIKGGKSDSTHFHLFPPLGTAEAIAIQKKRCVKINTDITAPTGKTGVAYGLIIGREGGPIRVITQIQADSQSKFMFNIGKARKGRFSMVLDRNEAVYGQWVRFGVASSEDFEIYYTSLPSAGKMPVTDTAIHKIRCRIPAPDTDSDIYIRTVEEAPEDLEYCVAKEKEPDETAEVFRVHLAG